MVEGERAGASTRYVDPAPAADSPPASASTDRPLAVNVDACRSSRSIAATGLVWNSHRANRPRAAGSSRTRNDVDPGPDGSV
ncbi:hypothetical protein CMsap09_16095 [Clavibacter michiganensis]|uniref:Uncharacterized protein n=1 Tax=Clavibacter michiganensis TaxID=28447 RepID=A0A251XY59_9MICO|nr:hypothetical protein CMsap09_16095 [Clavibacter michiganensis]